MAVSAPRHVKSSRKAKNCSWCWQRIEVGQPKVSWFTYGENVQADLHPECYIAQGKADLYDEELPPPGTYRRGCWCGENEEHCKCQD